MVRFTLIGFASFLTIVAFAYSAQQESAEKQEPSSQQEESERKPAQDPDSISRRDFMRTKLRYTQQIFEGLTTGNLAAVRLAAREVHGITEGGQWVAIDNEQYRKLTEEFKTATERLIKAAETGNIEATAMRYYSLSTSCIDCHQHLRKSGYEL